jgi:hypothetical protein
MLPPDYPDGEDTIGTGPFVTRWRVPGYWDAQVSQRPIAIHANEHLASSDRGVALMRRMVREGIEAVEQGEDPKGLVREPNALMPVYANEILRRVPPAATPQEDQELPRQTSPAASEESRAGRRPRLTASAPA